MEDRPRVDAERAVPGGSPSRSFSWSRPLTLWVGIETISFLATLVSGGNRVLGAIAGTAFLIDFPLIATNYRGYGDLRTYGQGARRSRSLRLVWRIAATITVALSAALCLFVAFHP